MRYVALLRAINTPPRWVKMERLREVFRDLGYANVATVVASGNVVFDSDEPPDPERIETGLRSSLGFDVPTYVLSAAELVEILRAQPFPTDEGQIEISLLPAVPDESAARAVVALVSAPDRLAVYGRAVYWWSPADRSESHHSEEAVMKVLGMATTRRALATLHRIRDRC